MKLSELAQLFSLIQEEHPGEEFNQARESIWYAALGDLPIAIAVEATVLHIGASPFPPRPGDIRRRVEAMLDGLEANRRLAQLQRTAVWTGPEQEMSEWLDRWIYQPRRRGLGAGERLQQLGPGP